jgi:hypothetical protein
MIPKISRNDDGQEDNCNDASPMSPAFLYFSVRAKKRNIKPMTEKNTQKKMIITKEHCDKSCYSMDCRSDTHYSFHG